MAKIEKSKSVLISLPESAIEKLNELKEKLEYENYADTIHQVLVEAHQKYCKKEVKQ